MSSSLQKLDQNHDLKKSNELVFTLLEEKLKLDEEKPFVRAADKLADFICKSEAYYAEARPRIKDLIKTARATLTRLAASPLPFQISQSFSTELNKRVDAYVNMVSAAVPHVHRFEGDTSLHSEMKEIVASIAPRSPTRSEETKLSPNVRPSPIAAAKTEGCEIPVSSESNTPIITTGSSINTKTVNSASPATPISHLLTVEKTMTRNKKKLKLAKSAKLDPLLVQEDLEKFSSKHSQSPSVNLNPSPMIIRENDGSTVSSNNSNRDTPTIEPEGNGSPAPREGIAQDLEKVVESLVPGLLTMSVSHTDIPFQRAINPTDKMEIDQASQESPLEPNSPSQTCTNAQEDRTIQNQSPRPESLFRLSPTSYLYLGIGRAPGEKLEITYKLDPDHKRLISLWKEESRSKQISASGLCLSLTCHKYSDILRSEMDHKNECIAGWEKVSSLKPTWPMDGGVFATIGQHQISLAPPISMSSEGFVDISHLVQGEEIEIVLEHISDMSDFIFALITHPPTPSQIQNAMKANARFRITYTDVFGND